MENKVNQIEKYIYQEFDSSALSRTELRDLRAIVMYHYNQGDITLNDHFRKYCEKIGIDLELNYGL